MSKKISISPRFDEKAEQLRKDGFTAIYKARWHRVPGTIPNFIQTHPGERIRLNDNSFALEKGETWGLVYWDGKYYQNCFFPPDPVQVGWSPSSRIYDEKERIEMELTPDPENHIKQIIKFHRCRAENVIATFATADGERKEIKTHRAHLEKLPEWIERDPAAGYSITPVNGARDDRQVDRMLSYAVEELARECGDLTKDHWRILEAAFRAGRSSNESDSWNVRGISIAGEPMAVKQLTHHTARRVWTQAATEILRRDPKASSKSIALELKKACIVSFDEWGDDIEFYDESAETKSKGAFEKAISCLRKEIRK